MASFFFEAITDSLVQVVGTINNLSQRLFHLHRVPNPGNFPVLVHDEGGRNTPLTGCCHPVFGHLAFVRLAAVANIVHGHGVIHLVAHFLDEWLNQFRVVFPNAHTDERDVLLLFLKLCQVRDADLTGATPGRPELNHVDLSGFELVDLGPLHELGNGQWWGGITQAKPFGLGAGL